MTLITDLDNLNPLNYKIWSAIYVLDQDLVSNLNTQK